MITYRSDAVRLSGAGAITAGAVTAVQACQRIRAIIPSAERVPGIAVAHPLAATEPGDPYRTRPQPFRAAPRSIARPLFEHPVEVVIFSRRGFHPAGPGAGAQGTLSRLVPRCAVWLPLGRAVRRPPPLVPFP